MVHFQHEICDYFTQWSKYIYNIYVMCVCVLFFFIKFLSLPYGFCMNSSSLTCLLRVFFRFFHPFAIVFLSLLTTTTTKIHTYRHWEIFTFVCIGWFYIYVCRKPDSVKWTTFANVLRFNHCYIQTNKQKLCSCFGFISYSNLWTNS